MLGALAVTSARESPRLRSRPTIDPSDLGRMLLSIQKENNVARLEQRSRRIAFQAVHKSCFPAAKDRDFVLRVTRVEVRHGGTDRSRLTEGEEP